MYIKLAYHIAGVVVLDVDECDAGISGCNHNCTNTMGSYMCSCDEGYDLDSNGLTCVGERRVLIFFAPFQKMFNYKLTLPAGNDILFRLLKKPTIFFL